MLEAAIGYAEDGYPALPRVASSILPAQAFFQQEWPSSAEVWLPRGEVPRPRALFRNLGIAATYRRILAEANHPLVTLAATMDEGADKAAELANAAK